jgi:deoxyribonuclease V
MILAIDVAYSGSTALAAGILFSSWDKDDIYRELVCNIENIADYVPGEFYLRELPCINQLLEEVSERIDCIVIDGYVTLGRDKRLGLGMKLWEHLDGKIPIIGVAKTEFIGTPENTRIYRGGSSRPLFVTAIGIELDDAKSKILNMKGKFRIPELLKAVDRLCRQAKK